MAWLQAVIDVPADSHETAAAFWAEALGWSLGPAWSGHPELASFTPPAGAPYVHLQEVDAPARVHVDVEVDDRSAAADRAVGLGAELVAVHDRWHAMRSPGGLPFCLVSRSGHEAPQPVTWPGGHRSRLVQVCIDSPPPVHDAEVEFWRALLEGRWVPSDGPEFAGKCHDDDGSPLQLLFQRTEDPGGPVRAHLDWGTDDLAAEVKRLVALGADDVGPGRGWHVLRAPDGQLFCATLNAPDTVRKRDLD